MTQCVIFLNILKMANPIVSAWLIMILARCSFNYIKLVYNNKSVILYL